MSMLLASIMGQHALTDPYWSNVASLNHFDGSNGSTTLTDETGLSWTVYGSAQLSTAHSVFGPSSLALNGSTDYISGTTGAPFQFGTSDLTVECRIYLNSLPGVNGYSIFDNLPLGGDGTRTNAFVLIIKPSGKLDVFINGSFRGETITTLSATTDYAIALTRTSGTWRYFIDGVVDSTTFSNSVDLTSGGCVVGRVADTADYYLNGYIDELRVTNSISRYTTSYTPATTQFPNS